MRLLTPVLLTLVVVALPSCTSDGGERSSDARTDTTTIPFEKEGRLAFIQDREPEFEGK